MTVTEADILAGEDKSYDIQGSSPHTHTVNIGVAQFEQLAAEGMIMVDSIDGSHTHTVTVTCA
jgi:hypothetical protein